VNVRGAVRNATHVVSLLLVSGCTQAHLYPICFYNKLYPEDQIETKFLPQLETALRAAVGPLRTVQLASTPDARWFVAETTEEENTRLADVWARVGCIGVASDRTGAKQEADCVAYVREFILKKNYELGVHLGSGGVRIANEAPNEKLLVYCDPTYAPGFKATKKN
jgi:hypothetical protein